MMLVAFSVANRICTLRTKHHNVTALQCVVDGFFKLAGKRTSGTHDETTQADVSFVTCNADRIRHEITILAFHTHHGPRLLSEKRPHSVLVDVVTRERRATHRTRLGTYGSNALVVRAVSSNENLSEAL